MRRSVPFKTSSTHKRRASRRDRAPITTRPLRRSFPHRHAAASIATAAVATAAAAVATAAAATAVAAAAAAAVATAAAAAVAAAATAAVTVARPVAGLLHLKHTPVARPPPPPPPYLPPLPLLP